MSVKAKKEQRRCHWAQKPLMIEYHDREWGKPVHDDRVLFEFLTLEGAQAGLSWETILNKRENYRRAFDGFDAEKIARYDKRKVRALLARCGDRAQSVEDCGDDFECCGISGCAAGIRIVRPLRMAVCGRAPEEKQMGDFAEDSGAHGGIGCDEQGPEASRFPLRRDHYLLRVHAGRRHGQRSCARLFPL